MKIIPTTPLEESDIQFWAKAIVRKLGIAEEAALQFAATGAGYESWEHVQQCLRHKSHADAKAAPPHYQMPLGILAYAYSQYLARSDRAPKTADYLAGGRVFHDVTIENFRFQGMIMGDDSPSIVRVHEYDPTKAGFVQLGVSSIHDCPPDPGKKKGWWICKYGPREPRIDLTDMTTEGRNSVAYEFGLSVILKAPKTPEDDIAARVFPGGDWTLFYLSPAFQGLCAWAERYPRKARSRKAANSHLRGWGKSARNGQYVR